MAGEEAAELAVLSVTAAGPELGARTAQCVEGWYIDTEQKNHPKFRGLFAFCAAYMWNKQESKPKPSERLLSCRSLQ